MLREERHAKILELLEQKKLVTVGELSQMLKASYMTVWRDLDYLENKGYLQRIRGGALAIPKDPLHGMILDHPSVAARQEEQVDQKLIRLGRYAANELVSDHDTLTIESGIITSLMVGYLNKRHLTVLTNGLDVMIQAAPKVRELTLMSSGGVLVDQGALIGPQVEEFFNHHRVKKAFLSAEGVAVPDGFTDPTPLSTHLKQIMQQNAEQTIMLMDSSSLGVRSLAQVAALDDVDILVTDTEAPEKVVHELRAHGIDVRIA